MRIIAGRAGGIRLHAPKGDAVRPTTDRARETLFSVLGIAIQEARCLDLFAGTGALGIEALSRGAAHCTFVERNGSAIHALRDNLERARLAGDATVIAAEWQAALNGLARKHTGFDVVFLDPPWDTDLALRCMRRLEHLPGLVREALVVVEHRCGKDPLVDTSWRLLRRLQVGESCFSLCRCVQPADGP